MRYHDAEILALLLRLKKDVVSTSEIAPLLGISQQSASRKLRELDDKGLIRRELCKDGQRIAVLEKGVSLLKGVAFELDEASSGIRKPAKFKGYVVSGSGEGAYYLGQDGYFSQFCDKLGFTPFRGTLNLEVRDDYNLDIKERVLSGVPTIINGFSDSGRSFGDIMCFRCRINDNAEGALIVPERTHHDARIVEIVAPFNLREKMNLRDGDEVEVSSY